MTKVLFVYPDLREDAEEYSAAIAKEEWEGMYYSGIGSMSAVLKKSGHSTRLCHIIDGGDVGGDDGEKGRKKYIEQFYWNMLFYKPDIVAFSSTTNQFEVVRGIANEISEIRNALSVNRIIMDSGVNNFNKIFETFGKVVTICGGVHAILDPESVLSERGIDVVCTGEGEYVLLDMANGVKLCSIDGIWYKDYKKGDDYVVRNKMRKLIDNLDELPFGDREIFGYEGTYGGKLKRLDMISSRGCQYSCGYCCNSALRKVFRGYGKYVRRNSPEYVVNEIAKCLSLYPFIEYIDFRDDCFTDNYNWLNQFLDLYIEKFSVYRKPIVIISRADRLNEKVVKRLSEVPCRMVRVGIESGSDKVLSTLNRTVSVEKILEVGRLLKENGIKLYPFYMLGLPEETPDDFEKTIEVHSKLVKIGCTDIGTYHLSIFYPFVHTELYDYCMENNLICNENDKEGNESGKTNYFTDTILNLPEFPRDKILYYKNSFERLAKVERLTKERME